MHALKAFWDKIFGKRPTQGQILWLSVGFAVIAFILVLLPKNPAPSTPPTPSPSLSGTPSPRGIENITEATFATETMTPSVTPSSSIEKSATPEKYPTPFVGVKTVNAPVGFDVVYWVTDYAECDPKPNHNTFKVHGLIVPLGTPPYDYDFSFSRYNESFAPKGFTPTPSPTWTPSPTYTPTFVPVPFVPATVTSQPDPPRGELIIFDTPVVLHKGQYYNVIISFSWVGGTAIWIDDLYYPQTINDPRCS